MQNKVIVVFAHAGEKEMFNRHLPYWRQHNLPIILSTPKDAPLEVPIPTIRCGTSGHSGQGALNRVIEAFKAMLLTHYDVFLFAECDCVIFRKPPEHPGEGMTAFVFGNAEERFAAKQFPHGLWYFDRKTIKGLLFAIAYSPQVFEGGYGDRWLGALCQIAGLKIWHEATCFSRNSLDRPEFIRDAKFAYQNGAWWIHGIKTEEMLRQVIS